MINSFRTSVLLALFLTLAACGDRPAMSGNKADTPLAAVRPPSPGITLAGSEGAGGLALEDVVLVRNAPDIVELRTDLVNRGSRAAEVGSLRRALVGQAGPGAAALVTDDGGKRFYPLVRVDAGRAGAPEEGTLLEPGARIPIVIRFGPVAADVTRLTPVVPGFAASAPLDIADN